MSAMRLGAVRPSSGRGPQTPDLGSQLEELLVAVWQQEDFERKHPFTCAVIRETARRGTRPVGPDRPLAA